jgi:Rieske Fe-S protein
VEYVRETKSVPMDAGPVPKHPLLVCSCHFSVFDPLQHGRAISGPAHRGMYTFELERSGDVIGIERVDAEILELLG